MLLCPCANSSDLSFCALLGEVVETPIGHVVPLLALGNTSLFHCTAVCHWKLGIHQFGTYKFKKCQFRTFQGVIGLFWVWEIFAAFCFFTHHQLYVQKLHPSARVDTPPHPTAGQRSFWPPPRAVGHLITTRMAPLVSMSQELSPAQSYFLQSSIQPLYGLLRHRLSECILRTHTHQQWHPWYASYHNVC